MREEFGQTDIVEVTVQSRDWWVLFEKLSGRAHLTVVYVEALSNMLVREMGYLAAAHLRYVIFANDTEAALIAKSPDGELLLSSALERFKLGDVAALSGVLKRL